jgi:beta-1,4-mannosyl-glycoprotein beta-1,4-N-acetylglucosaminyltransferase
MEFTQAQARLRFLIVGAFIVALIFFLRSTERVQSHPIFDNIKSPWASPEGEAAPGASTPAAPDSPSPKPPPPATSRIDHTKPLPLDEARQWCDFRRYKPWTKRDKPRKIFDLVIINQELDWLDIRLGQMYSHVDYFVIVESEKTFTDEPKDLFVKKNWDRYKKYHNKMIRHTLKFDDTDFQSTWDREVFQRNAMITQVIPDLTGDKKAEMDDVIIIADVDEIPRPETLVTLRNCEIPDSLTLRSRMYYYSYQWLSRTAFDWPHPQTTLWKGPDLTPAADNVRIQGDSNDLPNLWGAAWHCSYCFSTLAETVNKVTSFSHSEFNKPEFKDPVKILQRVRLGLDFFDQEDAFFDRLEHNEDIPDFLKRDGNDKKYAFLLNRDPEDGNFMDAEEIFQRETAFPHSVMRTF